MKNDNINLEHEELNLEDLIIMGDDKKIPIEIEFPTTTGEMVKAKTLIKQLTLGEFDNIKLKSNTILESNLLILELGLFKTNGEHFTRDEMKQLPIGVVRAIAEKIMEISGITQETDDQLRDF